MPSGDQPGGNSPNELDNAIAPGGTIRFDVSDGQRRSAVWRIWTKDRINDVYVAAREVAGHTKISLHESGSWQHGFVSDERAKGFRLPEQLRHFAIWQRPAELLPGWTRAMQIVIPDASLQARPSKSTATKPVVDILPVETGDTTVVEVWLESQEPHQPLNLSDSRIIARLRQPNGVIVWVVAHRLALTWDPSQRFAEHITAAHDAAIEQQPNWTGDEPLSICLHDPDRPTPDLILWELAVTALVQRMVMVLSADVTTMALLSLALGRCTILSGAHGVSLGRPTDNRFGKQDHR